MVPSQLNVLIGAGERDHHGRHHEGGAERGVHARHEHVMAPDDEAEARDAGDRVHHRLVAEERLAGEAVLSMSETMPIAGKIMMYTAGWL